MEALMLARIQFAFTISFHILFPAFTIGLASWLVMLEALWLKTGKPRFMSLYKFWLKIFAVSFGMGVVSGIVMSFQFGSNWSRFSEATGNVLGPVIGYEVLTAFFLEATFLGIMLFGANRVGKGLHFFSTCMVAIGTLISAFWILSANSWMHTPAGFRLEDGIFYAEDWWEIVFNPSFPYRFIHMVLAAYLTTCFVIGAVGARYLLRNQFPRRARLMFFMSVVFGAIVVPAQILMGDFHGLNTKEYQPQKVAAMEAHWDSEPRAPLILFAIPDEEAETNHFQVGIPGMGSLILEHDINAPVTGLKEFPPDERPPVAPVFFAFRVMVGLGVLMLFAAGAGVVQLLRGRLYETRWLLKLYTWMWPAGFIAILAGWFTTEIGRQPWIVWELQRTADAVSPVPASSIATSLALFFVVYGVVFGAGIYYLFRLIRSGPGEIETEPEEEEGTARRPLSAAGRPAEEGT